MKFTYILSALVFVFHINTASAVPDSCASPQETTTNFYDWYLKELNNDNYPLTSLDSRDVENLNKWLSPELLKELHDEIFQNNLDAEYFTDAQDIFDDWVENVSAHEVKATTHEVDMDLTLGTSENQRKYDVFLSDKYGCWQINCVVAEK